MKVKHQEHLVCVKSERLANSQNGLIEYDLELKDLMLGQRAVLEKDPDFRQVLPVSVFLYRGAVWAYERTSKGGESRLHNKIAVAVGGHWDMADIRVRDGLIDLDGSLEAAIQRELAEEIVLSSKIINTYRLPKMICSDETEVDRVHLGMVWVHELDGDDIVSGEEQLKTLGFVDHQELLRGAYNIETWARIICQMLVSIR